MAPMVAIAISDGLRNTELGHHDSRPHQPSTSKGLNRRTSPLTLAPKQLTIGSMGGRRLDLGSARRNMRRQLVVLVIVCLIFPATRPATALASCAETHNFVQQVAGTNLYYGNRDAIFTYNDLPNCSPGSNAQSTFMRTREDYLSWVEAGIYESNDGVLHYWTEWRAYPNPVILKTYDSSAGTAKVGAWYSFEITDVGSGAFAIYRATGSDPDTASWHFLQFSDTMPRDVGEAESEESTYGTGNAQDYAYSLETQNRQSQGWGLWTNLQCDQFASNMTGWYETKYNNGVWANTQTPPGLC